MLPRKHEHYVEFLPVLIQHFILLLCGTVKTSTKVEPYDTSL